VKTDVIMKTNDVNFSTNQKPMGSSIRPIKTLYQVLRNPLISTGFRLIFSTDTAGEN
jgi:hypothetical protein